MLHLGKVVCEKEEAEEISDEDEAGMALECGIRTGEGNFAKADQQGFDEQDGAGDQDRGVKQRSRPSPEEQRGKKGGRGQPRQRKQEENAPGYGSGVLLAGIEPVSEDLISAEVYRHLEGEANSDNDAVGQDERDGEEF